MSRLKLDVTQNAASWDFANTLANSRKGDFAKSIWRGFEVLPPDMTKALALRGGEHVLQPMCNDGRELLYLSLRYDAVCTGIDVSNSAVEFAVNLAERLSVQAKFIRSDAIEWISDAGECQFDLVMTTLGTLWWVDNLSAWFESISRILKKGGRYILWDFHPLSHCFDENAVLFRDYPFEPVRLEHPSGIGDYTQNENDYILVSRAALSDEAQRNPYPVTDYRWSLANVINSIVSNTALRLIKIDELPSLWEERYFPWLIRKDRSEFISGGKFCRIPLAFRLEIEKL